MLLAGQNKHCGRNIEQATETWRDVGIDHIMVKSNHDTALLSSWGNVIEEDFSRLGKLQKEYGVKYHLHPYNIFVTVGKNGYNLDFLNEETVPIYRKALKRIDDLIQENELYPLLTMHLTVMDYPFATKKQTEAEALRAGKNFFQSLDLKTQLGLETTHDPYRNPRWSLLGYKPEHFSEVIGDKDMSLVIDTGHLNIAQEPLEKFLKLPYSVASIHFNGNSGKEDEHAIPTRKNIKDADLVEELLKKVEGPIVFEIQLQKYGYSRDEIMRLIENTRTGKIV
jgi:sugar phosphate isomerase/epimerase